MKDIAKLLMSYSSTKRMPKEIYTFRVYNLLKEYNYNPDQLKYVHITGSKGKGSLAVTTFELLTRKVKNVGLFISPHIFDIRERFVTQKGMIPQERLEDLTKRFDELFKKKDLHYFEMCLFLALVYFIEENCEFVVLEVGVGGRFDPTNFCNPKISLLAHVSMEHREFLGDTIEEIAYDKAGIIKVGIPAFSVDQELSVVKIFKQQGQVLFFSDFIKIINLRHILQNGYEFDLQITLNNTINISNIKLSRIGKANIINFALAVAGIYQLFPDYDSSYVREVAQIKIPYRMDKITENIIVDTAHNGISFENLMCFLQESGWTDIVCCFTILQGKELDLIVEVIKKYKHIINKTVFFDFVMDNKRHSDAYELYIKTKEFVSSVYCEDLSDIVLGEGEKTVFAGSFYSIPQVMNLITNFGFLRNQNQ